MQTLVASKVNEDFGETVPSRLHNVGLQVPHNVAPMSGSEKEHLNDSVDAAGEGIYAKTSGLYQIQTFFCERHGYYVVFFRNVNATYSLPKCLPLFHNYEQKQNH